MTLKKAIGWIHLWLGLATGLVVFLVSITGCVYAFQKEIQDFTQSWRFFEHQPEPVLAPSRFEKVAKETLPQYHLHAINYPGQGRTVEAIFYGDNPQHYYVIYHNPYTAEVVHVQNMDATFFRWVLMGHYYLWLPPEIGQVIVAYSTLIFVVMMITGIILWWPKNRSAARQRFWYRWKSGTKWRRKNYDLHNITGFYGSSLLLIVALTGMVFGIQWFAYGVYRATGGQKSVAYEEPLSNPAQKQAMSQSPIDAVWQIMRRDHPDAVSIEVHTIETDSSAISANANTQSDLYWTTDYRYFNQYTLEEMSVNHLFGRLKDADASDKLARMNYDIHVGAILGLPGKFLAFCLSLIAASLPITGFMIWYGRRKKNARKGRADELTLQEST